MRSACDSERPTTVTHGQSWSLDGCKNERAQSTFALVRALETSSRLVVRGRVELPTFRFSGWQTAGSRQGRARSLASRRSDIGDEDQGATVPRCHVRPGATLGATGTNDLPILRTHVNSGQQRIRGHGLI